MSHVSPSPLSTLRSRSRGESCPLSPRPHSRSHSRSPPTFLDPQRLIVLVEPLGTLHPLVRRHNAAKHLFVVYAQNQLVCHPVRFGELFFSREHSPSFRDLVDLANRRHLGLRQDIHLKARDLWRIFHRRFICEYEDMQPATNHHCIYVQSRSASFEETVD